MTNNINISVDIDKKCRSAHDEFSERNESVNTSNSGNSIMTLSRKGRNEMLQKIRNKQIQFDSMRRAADIDSTRKIAGKHISIFLNTKKTEEGEDIDIKICSKPNKTTVSKRSDQDREMRRSL